MTGLNDKARSILVFAAYHSLSSGEDVREVVLDDGKGHKADQAGVDELAQAGLLEADGPRGRFTEAGHAALAEVLAAIRAT